MFGSLGVPELMLILAVALIVFGPRKLPEIGRTLGKALGEFRKATDDLKNTLEREVRMEELRTIAPAVMTPVESVSRTEPFAGTPAVAAPTVDVATPPDADPTPVADATAHAEAVPVDYPMSVGEPMSGRDATSSVVDDDTGTLQPAMKSE